MPSPYAERCDAAGGEVEGLLFAGDAGRRFHGRAHDEFVAVGYAARDAARMVGRRAAVGVGDRVVMGGTAQGCCGEPVAELHPFDRGDGEEQVCCRAFDRVEKGFAPAGGDARYAALDDAAHGVFVAQGVVDRVVEPRRIGLAADGGQPRGEGRTAEYFFRYDARGYECQRQSAREVAAAPRVVPSFELDGRRAVGVRRTGLREQVVVVARTGVGVFEDERQRCARGVSLVESRHDLRQVVFLARRRPFGAAAASGQIGFEIGNVERKPGRYAVERDADLRTVGFAPKGDAEESAEAVHRYGSVKAATCHSTPPYLKALPARRALLEAPAKAGVWGWIQSVNAA